MKKITKSLPVVLLLLWDWLSVYFAVTAGFRLRFGMSQYALRLIPDFYLDNQFLFILLCYFVYVFLNILFDGYAGILKRAGIGDLLRGLGSVMCYAVALICFDRLLQLGLPIEVIIITSLLLFLFWSAGRMSVRVYHSFRARLNRMRYRKEMKRVLIYGAGELGSYLIHKLRSSPDDRMVPVALLDDNSDLWGKKLEGVPVIGGRQTLETALKERSIDEVLVSMTHADRALLREVVTICRKKGCSVRRFGTLDDMGQENLGRISITPIDLRELLGRSVVELDMDKVRSFVSGQTVLVTGGVGSIGSEISRQLLRFGAGKVILFDIHENGLFAFDNELKKTYSPDRYELIVGSVRDKLRLKEIFDRYHPSIVFHAAAHKHVPMMELNPREAIKNNVMGTANVAQAAIIGKAKKFILISTDKAVNPTNIMGASKRIAELIIQMMDPMSDTSFAAVRFGNVLGSNGSVVPFFQKQIESGGPVTVTHPDMKRYFMTIPEAAQLVLEAGAMADGGEIFVLDMGEPVKIYDLACDMIRLSGYEPEVDIPIQFIGLRPGEKLFEEISLKDEDVTKTSNNKIFICKPIENDPTLLCKRIKALEEQAVEGSELDMFDKVKDLVPTFDHNGKEENGKEDKAI